MKDFTLKDLHDNAMADPDRRVSIECVVDETEPIVLLDRCFRAILEDDTRTKDSIVAKVGTKVLLRYSELLEALMAVLLQSHMQRFADELSTRKGTSEMNDSNPVSEIVDQMHACAEAMEEEDSHVPRILPMTLYRLATEVGRLGEPHMSHLDILREQAKDQRLAEARAIMRKVAAVRKTANRNLKVALINQVESWLDAKE